MSKTKHTSGDQLAAESSSCMLTLSARRWHNDLPKSSQQTNRFEQFAVELLIHILEDVVEPTTWTMEQLHTLAMVSKGWLGVVRSTPSLWSVARYGGPCCMSLDHVALALSKSKDTQLSIILEDTVEAKSEGIQQFVKAVAKHSHRWRTASFRTRFTGIVVRALSELSAPHLESLACEQAVHILSSFDALEDDLWFGSFELKGELELRTLSLRSMVLIGNAEILAGLRVLVIGNIIEELDIPPEQLLAVLSCCPRLENLCLEGITYNPSRPDAAIPPPINLPNLHTLDVFDISRQLFLPLAACIRAENVTCLRIFVKGETGVELLQTLAQPAVGLGPLIQGAALPNERLNVVESTGGVHILGTVRRGSEREDFDLYFQGVGLEEGWEALSPWLPSVALSVTIYNAPPEVLGRMSGVRSLHVGPRDGAPGDVLEYLGRPQMWGPNSTFQWPCPKLGIVFLTPSAYDTDQQLLCFVLNRYSANDKRPRIPPSDPSDDSGGPAPLGALILKDRISPIEPIVLREMEKAMVRRTTWVTKEEDGTTIYFTQKERLDSKGAWWILYVLTFGAWRRGWEHAWKRAFRDERRNVFPFATLFLLSVILPMVLAWKSLL